jgi:carnitine 3-dehydrogenase
MALIAADKIKTVAILGAGVIGSGWAARALANGLDVIAWDPAPNGEATLRANIANAWPALERVGLKPGASQSRLKVVKTVEECVKDADFIQESAPEREDLKRKLHAQITKACKPNAIIGSSTSGLLPSDFYKEAKNPERCLVGHPFNPVYLLPLVEVCGSKWTTDEAKQIAIAFYKSLGMRPLHVRKEVPGFLADRLLEAVWREGMHMINDDYCTTGELDDAIRFGFGIRWSFFGMYMIYHMAGGDAGMRHFLAQFGPALELPWTHLKAPKLTDEIIDKIVDGTEQQAGTHSIKELERLRDDCIIDVIAAITNAKAKHGWKYED